MKLVTKIFDIVSFVRTGSTNGNERNERGQRSSF